MKTKEEVILLAKNKVADDCDISEYIDIVDIIIEDIFNGSKMEECIGYDSDTSSIVEVITVFHELAPGGSQGDYLASALVDSFENIKIIALDEKLILEPISKVIDEIAIYPEREKEKLYLLDSFHDIK